MIVIDRVPNFQLGKTCPLADGHLSPPIKNGLKHLMIDAYSTPHVCIPTPNSLTDSQLSNVNNSLTLESWESVRMVGQGMLGLADTKLTGSARGSSACRMRVSVSVTRQVASQRS